MHVTLLLIRALVSENISVYLCVCACAIIAVIVVVICLLCDQLPWTTKLVQLCWCSPPGLILIGYGKTGRERRSAGEDPQALSVESIGSIFHSHRGLREQKGLDLQPAAG